MNTRQFNGLMTELKNLIRVETGAEGNINYDGPLLSRLDERKNGSWVLGWCESGEPSLTDGPHVVLSYKGLAHGLDAYDYDQFLEKLEPDVLDVLERFTD